MGEQLDNRVVKPGDVVPVRNLDSKINECDEYRQVWIEDCDGGNERPILLTRSEINSLADVHPCDVLNEMKAGRLYHFGKTHLVRVEIVDGVPQAVYMPRSLIKRGEARAAKNKEDIVKVGIIIDWLT